MTPPRSRSEDDNDDWVFDPGLAAINRSLHRELREEASEVEAIVAESELRERVFADVAKEARNRGDVVSIGTQQRTFNGKLRYAAGDFLTLETESFQVDINVAVVAFMRVVRKGARRGGDPLEAGPGTFEMRLIERKSVTDVVEIGYRDLEETTLGRIVTVGQDHIVLLTEQKEEWTIPHASIAWIIRRPRRR